jgi:hypothetical protein
MGWSDPRGLYGGNDVITLELQMFDTMLGDKFHRKLGKDNLIRMVDTMDDYKFKPNERQSKRMRMTLQLAETLLADMGDQAYVFALEKVNENPSNQLWRDTLSWMDELTKEKGESK